MTNSPMLMTIDAHQTNLSLLKQYYQNPQLFSGGENSNRTGTICHVSVFGPTSHRFNGLDANCNKVLCYRDLRSELEPLKNDASVEKVFIEFDGPGGEASGCFDFAEYIAEFAKVKPIIGFINGSSFSANYALASACTELFISPHSLGGSIGAIYGRREVIDDQQKMTYFKTGEAKADGAPLTTLDTEESARHQEMVDGLGVEFFALVAANRGVSADNVKALQAKIFTAKNMLEHGLVDGIKTEEEIKLMMTDKTHNKIVSELNATHAAEKITFTTQIQELQAVAEEQSVALSGQIKNINNLAKSAGVPEMAGLLIEQGVDEKEAARQLTVAAAAKDEEISLTSGLDSDDDQSYDMQQLIKDA